MIKINTLIYNTDSIDHNKHLLVLSIIFLLTFIRVKKYVQINGPPLKSI